MPTGRGIWHWAQRSGEYFIAQDYAQIRVRALMQINSNKESVGVSAASQFRYAVLATKFV